MTTLLLFLLLSIAPDRTTADSVVVRRIADRILERYEQGYRSGKDGKEYTDDSAAAEAMGFKVRLSKGSAENIKITAPMDLEIAVAILRRRHE